MIEGVQKGHFQLVYFTPESLLQSKRWLLSDLYQMKLKTVVFTALLHGVLMYITFSLFQFYAYRGLTFREVFQRVGEV